MSALDENVNDALNRTLDALQAHVESDLASFREELSRAVEAERTRLSEAAAETTRETERQFAEWRAAAARDAEDRERDFHARLRQAEAREHDAEARENEARAERHEAEARREFAERTIDELRRSLEQAEQNAKAELENAQHELKNSEQRISDLRIERDTTRQQVEEHRQTIQALEHKVQQSEKGLIAAVRLPDALRQMDQAGSLGEVLDALAQCAGREAERVVVFLLKGERLRDWRAVGFDHPSGPRIDLLASEAGPVGIAARGDGGLFRVADLPAFAVGVGPRQVLTLPVTVGGAVVAVLYADAPDADNEGEPAWAARLDVLARYAGRILESITIRQAAGLPAIGVVRSAGSPSPVSGHPPPGGIQ